MIQHSAFITIVFTTTLALGTAFGQTCLTPPANLTQWWLADGSTKDARGDNDGTLRNGTTYGAGQVGQAFQLDGTNDFINIPAHPALDFGTGDFTLNFWVKFNTTAGEQVMIEKYVETFNNGTATGWSLTKLDGDSVRFAVPPENVDSAGLTIPSGVWIHFAARRSGGTFTLFMNGAQIAADSFNSIDLNSPSSLKLGHRGDPSDTPGSTDTRGFFLNGFIDEVQLFVGYALSDAEIQAIYDAGSDGQCRSCGNGTIDPGEDCDDANPVNGDGCENDCTFTCGDGTTSGSEECDDGNTVSGDGCDGNCTVTGCGNGLATSPEQCDDGNTAGGDGCSATCTFEPVCGNGIVTATTGEACDDGNLMEGDGCSSNCQDSAEPETQTDPELTTGETLTSDVESDGATPADPVETTIVMSVGTASATIEETSGPGPAVPGYAFFGQQVHITFDCPGAPCPSAGTPLTLDFRIDASRIPAGEDETSFVLFHDGVAVPACTGAPGIADPDPCVAHRQPFIDGDIGVTVLTSLASEWGFARGACAPVVLVCDDGGKALFQVKRTPGDPSATKLLWKWGGGTITAPTFGAPTLDANYTLCVYDGAALVEGHEIAPGGDCNGKPCWKALGTEGFLYKNRSGSGDGITKLLLKSGAGNAKILLKGKGPNVAVPASAPIFMQTSDLTVQLVSGSGNCWEAVYPGPATSTGTAFKDQIP